MKKYLFYAIILSGIISSHAMEMDDVSHKTEKVRKAIQQLCAYVNEMDAEIVHDRQNKFQSLETYKQDNNRLIQENELLRKEIENTPKIFPQFSQSPVAILQYSTLNQGKIKEVIYTEEGYFSRNSNKKTIHLYLETQIYKTPEVSHIIESNENYYKQFGFLNQEIGNLSQVIAALTKEKNERDIDIADTQERLTATIQQKEEYMKQSGITIQNLENFLIASRNETESLKKKSDTYLTEIKKLKIEKRTIISENEQFKKDIDMLRSSSKKQEEKINELHENIKNGSYYVETLKRQAEEKVNDLKRDYQEKRIKEDKENKVKLDKLMSEGIEKLNLIENERALAVAGLRQYKEIVSRVLSAPGVPEELLAKIDRLNNNITF